MLTQFPTMCVIQRFHLLRHLCVQGGKKPFSNKLVSKMTKMPFFILPSWVVLYLILENGIYPYQSATSGIKHLLAQVVVSEALQENLELLGSAGSARGRHATSGARSVNRTVNRMRSAHQEGFSGVQGAAMKSLVVKAKLYTNVQDKVLQWCAIF